MKKQIIDSQSDHTKLDEHIKKTLNGMFPLPEQVENARNEAYAKIRAMAADTDKKDEMDGEIVKQQEKSTKGSKKARKIFFPGFAGIAAAAAVFFCIYMVNPTVVAEVPIVKHVFEKFGESLEFAGDYTNLAEPMSQSETGIESLTVDGNTITLSEIYCNEATLYLALIIHSKEKIPETYLIEGGKPQIDIEGMIDFDFDQNGELNWWEGGSTFIDGAMVDDYTFAGVVRFEMAQYFSYEGFGTQVPENFNIKMSVSRIVGTKLEDTRPEMPQEIRDRYEAAMEENGLGLTDEDYAQFTEEQEELEHQFFNDMWNAYYELYPDRQTYPNQYDNWFLTGPWDFEFEVTRKDDNVIRKEINDLDENGIGIISVTKTPVEIALEMEQNTDYTTIILDANGTLMGESALGYQNTAPVGGYDTSKIDVYVCESMEYMDEIHGYWWSDTYEGRMKQPRFKQALDERCVYHKEITFDE